MWVFQLNIRGSQPVKAPNGGCKFVAFFAFEKQLCNFLASPLIIGRGDWLLFLFLVLVVDGTEAILWINLLVLCFRVFGFDLPNAFLLQWK
jgi:hypothetical protein